MPAQSAIFVCSRHISIIMVVKRAPRPRCLQVGVAEFGAQEHSGLPFDVKHFVNLRSWE